MVNQIVLEYLRVNKGNYNISDLKKKVLSSGYSQQDVDEAMMQLNKETQGNVPSVNATINKINKTNIPVEIKSVEVASTKHPSTKPKKSKWFWIIWALITLLIVGSGIAVWMFWDQIIGLF